MARGWESKSVEDQIGDAEAAKDSANRPLSRARTREPPAESAALAEPNMGRMKAATNAQYRVVSTILNT